MFILYCICIHYEHIAHLLLQYVYIVSIEKQCVSKLYNMSLWPTLMIDQSSQFIDEWSIIMAMKDWSNQINDHSCINKHHWSNTNHKWLFIIKSSLMINESSIINYLTPLINYPSPMMIDQSFSSIIDDGWVIR